MNECYNCGHALSERARFCSACKVQVRCKSCGEDLEAKAIACEMCGEDVSVNSGQLLNRIKYTEDRKGRTFEAEFTDRVGESVGGTFAALLSRNGSIPPVKTNKTPISSSQGVFNYAEEVEDVKHSELDNQQLQIPESVITKTDGSPKADASELLQLLFEQTDNGWILEETELKAASKADFVKRVTCLFLHYQHEKGVLPVSRAEVLALLNHCGVYDGNVRRWFREEKSLMHVTPKDLKLKLPGIQLAKEILAEMLNEEVAIGWKIGTKAKGGRKLGSKKEKSSQDTE